MPLSFTMRYHECHNKHKKNIIKCNDLLNLNATKFIRHRSKNHGVIYLVNGFDAIKHDEIRKSAYKRALVIDHMWSKRDLNRAWQRQYRVSDNAKLAANRNLWHRLTWLLCRGHTVVMAPQTNVNWTVCLTNCSDEQQRKHRRSTSLALCAGILPMTVWFSAQWFNDAERVFLPWRRHETVLPCV